MRPEFKLPNTRGLAGFANAKPRPCGHGRGRVYGERSRSIANDGATQLRALRCRELPLGEVAPVGENTVAHGGCRSGSRRDLRGCDRGGSAGRRNLSLDCRVRYPVDHDPGRSLGRWRDLGGDDRGRSLD
jgi:hypothetical protein